MNLIIVLYLIFRDTHIFHLDTINVKGPQNLDVNLNKIIIRQFPIT